MIFTYNLIGNLPGRYYIPTGAPAPANPGTFLLTPAPVLNDLFQPGSEFPSEFGEKSIFLIFFFENFNHFHQNIEKKIEILIFLAAPAPSPVLQFWSTPAPAKS